MNNAFQLHTRKQAAERLSVSVRTLDEAVRREKIGMIRLGPKGGRVLFRDSDLEAFAINNAVPANPAAI